MQVTLDLGSIEFSLRKRLGTVHGAHPDFDDGIQEALLRAWKDLEEGVTDRKYILNRAQVWFTSRVYGDSHPWTGAPAREKGGFRKESPNREKVQQYETQYYELHREVPSTAQIAQATGLSWQNVDYHRKKLKTYSSHLMREDGGSRLDRKSYIHQGLENAEGDTFDHLWIDPGFEEELGAEDNFRRMISYLEDREKTVFTLRYRYGMSNTEIGKQLWPEEPSTVSRQRVNKSIARGIKRLRK